MNTIEPRILKGFRDYLPDQMIARQQMLRTIESVFERYGFAPLQTPAIEYADILLGKYGADAERLLYRFTDNGGRDVCLRYDLTVPLARIAAQYQNLTLPFKRYQIAPVWRAEKPAKGRFREFFQCDVDVVGSASLLADAECIAVDNDVLTALGISQFVTNLNNRKVLTGLLEVAGLGMDEERDHAVLRTLDKLPAMGEKVVRGLLASDNLLDAVSIDRIFEFASIGAHSEQIPSPSQGEGRVRVSAPENSDKLDRAASFLAGSETGLRGLAELRDTLAYAAELGVPPERLRIDFSIARGLDYYTGSVFETFLLGLPGFGSVMSGGRYDHLISTFLGREMPAVGISVGIDRLFSGMTELGLVKAAKTPTRVLVAPMGAEGVRPALAAASALRAAGLPTEVYLGEAKIAKQLKYADQRGIEVAVIIGSDEAAAGEATIKVMASGEQMRVPLKELPQRVQALLQGSQPV